MVKLMYCLKCRDIVQLTDNIRFCNCGNMNGKYLDDNTVGIKIDDPKDGKLIRLDNNFLLKNISIYEHSTKQGIVTMSVLYATKDVRRIK